MDYRKQQPLCTDRLLLRSWQDADLAPFAQLNADPRVMEYFPKPLTRIESDFFATRIRAHFAQHGFGLWAVELPGVTSFAGFVGLNLPDFAVPFMPCVEVGWRLAAPYWNQGYATEAARAAVAHGFTQLGLSEIVSFTATQNLPSRRVMEKIGMTHNPTEDFQHPKLALDSPLRHHVLYRLRKNST